MSTIGEALAKKAAEAPAGKKKNEFTTALARVAGTPHMQIPRSSGDKKNEPRNRPKNGPQEKTMNDKHTQQDNPTTHRDVTERAFAQTLDEKLHVVAEASVKTAAAMDEKLEARLHAQIEASETRQATRLKELQTFTVTETAKAVAQVQAAIAAAEARQAEAQKLTVKGVAKIGVIAAVGTAAGAAVLAAGYGAYTGIKGMMG